MREKQRRRRRPVCSQRLVGNTRQVLPRNPFLVTVPLDEARSEGFCEGNLTAERTRSSPPDARHSHLPLPFGHICAPRTRLSRLSDELGPPHPAGQRRPGGRQMGPGDEAGEPCFVLDASSRTDTGYGQGGSPCGARATRRPCRHSAFVRKCVPPSVHTRKCQVGPGRTRLLRPAACPVLASYLHHVQSQIENKTPACCTQQSNSSVTPEGAGHAKEDGGRDPATHGFSSGNALNKAAAQGEQRKLGSGAGSPRSVSLARVLPAHTEERAARPRVFTASLLHTLSWRQTHALPRGTGSS